MVFSNIAQKKVGGELSKTTINIWGSKSTFTTQCLFVCSEHLCFWFQLKKPITGYLWKPKSLPKNSSQEFNVNILDLPPIQDSSGTWRFSLGFRCSESSWEPGHECLTPGNTIGFLVPWLISLHSVGEMIQFGADFLDGWFKHQVEQFQTPLPRILLLMLSEIRLY